MRREWKVLAVVFCGLLATELTLRAAQDTLSGDVEHLNRADSIVRAVAEGDGLRILLVGNSLLFSGVDPTALESEVEAQLDRPVSLGMIHPDGTGPMQWSYLYRRLVFGPGLLPDVMVVAFGPGHLRDRSPESELLRLAAHHVDSPDIGMLLRNDITGLDEQMQFLLARVSTTFALRDRLAPRVFDAIIPRYRELAPILLRAPAPDERAGATPSRPTYVFLERLLEDASRAGLPLLAMPMPAPTAYEVDSGAASLFRVHGVDVLPTNVDIRLEPARFPDQAHLDEQGKQRFTAFLGPRLSATLAGMDLQ